MYDGFINAAKEVLFVTVVVDRFHVAGVIPKKFRLSAQIIHCASQKRITRGRIQGTKKRDVDFT